MPEQFSPVRLFVTLLVPIFCIEGAMMFALGEKWGQRRNGVRITFLGRDLPMDVEAAEKS